MKPGPRCCVVAIALVVQLASPIQAEQITWSFASSTGSSTVTLDYPDPNHEGLDDPPLIPLRVRPFGKLSEGRRSPILTEEFLREAERTNEEHSFLGLLAPFEPLGAEIEGDRYRIFGSPKVSALVPGTLTLSHSETGDQETWSFQLRLFDSYWPDDERSLGMRIEMEELLEGNGNLGPYPYTLYSTNELNGMTHLHYAFDHDAGPIGIAFWPAEEGEPMANTPEPDSILLAATGITLVGVGVWHRRRTAKKRGRLPILVGID